MVNLTLFGVLIFFVQFKITSWIFTFLSDFIKNLLLYLPLKKYIGAGAGPKILTFLKNGANFNNSDEKISNFLSNFDDNIILQFYGKNYENYQSYSIFKPISVTELKHLSDHNINNTKNIKYLIDNMDSALGGTGKKFDWSNLDNIDLSNLMIAGGLSIEDIPTLKEMGVWGVDLNSKLEIAPGIKDTKLIEQLRHYYE